MTADNATQITGKAKAPKWEIDARERVKTCLRRFTKPMTELVARDANEGDTRLLVNDILAEALGYDKYVDLTTEYRVRGEFADYGIRIDQQVVAFVEVKRATTKLNQRHLRQVEMYAVNEGVPWMILTNGSVWQVYHIEAGMPVSVDLVLEVNLLDEATKPADKVDAMFYLTREAFKRGQIEHVWRASAATAPERLAEVILSDAVLAEASRELRRRSNHRVEPADLGRMIRDTVIRPDLTK